MTRRNFRNPGKIRPFGFLLPEVVFASFLLAVCLIPILLLLPTTRKETARGVNRLRMLELALETLDWTMVCPFDRLDKLAGLANGTVSGVPVGIPENKKMEAFTENSPQAVGYSTDYVREIKRTIEITPSREEDPFLREARIRIFWTEAGNEFSLGVAGVLLNDDDPNY